MELKDFIGHGYDDKSKVYLLIFVENLNMTLRGVRGGGVYQDLSAHTTLTVLRIEI